MADVKIFVSHRIDINSELIDNPLYIPMRCGAVFDKENFMDIAGDDTGDNISERRMSFCEFTVQYWAWKNADADYYGLCHYRRYLSFADKNFKTDEYNMIHEASLTPMGKKKYGLMNPNTMKSLIEKYDIVTSEYADVRKIPTPIGNKDTVLEHWKAHDGEFLKKESIDLLLELIDDLAPKYSKSSREYLNGTRYRGFNCFVMNRALFQRMCEFQFPIMFEVERRLDTTGYTQTMMRTPAFLGEMLYGIFLYYVTTYEHWKVKELQLVYFQNTEKIRDSFDLICRYLWYWTDRSLRAVVDPVFPKGSNRREILKNVFYTLTPAERRGVANIKTEKRNMM